MTPLELRPDAASGVPFDALAEASSLRALPSALELEVPEPAGLSLRTNFAWVLTGNVMYAACQWGTIMVLAKLGNSFMVGQLSLGFAIATPVLMFTNLDLRAVQATDATRRYRFAEYLRLRLVTTLAGLAMIAGIVLWGNYERATAAVVIAVALAKSVESLSDLHYGLFQLNERLDQTGRSMMLRGALSLVALSIALRITHNVLWGCVWMAVAWLGVLLCFDARRGRRMVARTERPGPGAPAPGFARQRRLLGLALPLGLVTTVASINLHMPRYFIHAHLGEHQLGLFSALSYATVAMTLVGDSMGNCAIPRMSRLYAAGKLAEYRALLFKLLAAGCVVGLSGVAIAKGAGTWLLTTVYSAEYAAHSRTFVLLMVAAAIHFAASMLTSGITSARCFRIQVPIFALVAGATALGCAHWVPSMGMAGGAYGAIAGASVRLVLAASVAGYLLFTSGSVQGEARAGL